MRVSERMFKVDSLRRVQDAQEAMTAVEKKLSTQKEVYRPSDDPLRYVTAAKFRSVVASKEQYVRNISDVRRSLSDNEAAVERIRDLLQKTRILLVQGANETLTTADTQLIARDVRASLESLIQFANDRGVDGYAFGGAKNAAEPFEALRDAAGNVTGVLYRGDRVERTRALEDGADVPVNLVGSELFQVDPDAANGVFDVFYPGQALGSVDDDANTVADLASGPTTGAFRVQGVRVPYDTATDSLLDIADRINASGSDVKARVAGRLIGVATAPAGTLASVDAATGSSAGTIAINGTAITVPANASLRQVIDAVNAVSEETGVTASAERVAGGVALRLDGGAVIEDIGTGRSDAFQRLGVTTAAPSPTNLQSREPLAYRLAIETANADQLFLDDEADNRLLERLGLTDGAHNEPNNVAPAAAWDRSIFAVLVDAIADLESGNGAELRDARLGEFDRGLQRLSELHADLGARVARLDVAEAREEEFLVQAKSIISASEDLDVSDAVIELRIAQMRLQTAIGAASNLPVSNLLNFL